MEKLQTTKQIVIFRRSDGNEMNDSASPQNDYVHVLKSLLVGATVANFEYWSEFIIRVQRDVSPTKDLLNMWGDIRIPPMFCLRLRNKWWVGSRDEWRRILAKFPIKSPPGIPEETPLQSSVLVAMLEAKILDICISQIGDLDISLSNGDELHVQGAGGQWDESWFLELPVDEPDREKWSIISTSDGTIHMRSPRLTIDR
jgi:hypothetical protein